MPLREWAARMGAEPKQAQWYAMAGMDDSQGDMRGLIISFVLLVSSGAVVAETIYVNDLLRVGVRSRPASDEAPLVVVTTGASLEVLERSGGYVKVRTDEGTVGWVNSVYVSGEPPARARIERMKAENERLQRELDELRTVSSDALEESDRLRAAMTRLRHETADLHARLSRLYNANSSETGREWRWLYVGALLLMFVMGLYYGVRWQKRRVAERLGGLEF